MTWPSYHSPHLCYYRRLQGSSQLKDNAMQWVERCRCGRLVKGFMRPVNGKTEVTKSWFNRDGDLERVTGYKPAGLENKVSETANPIADIDPDSGKVVDPGV